MRRTLIFAGIAGILGIGIGAASAGPDTAPAAATAEPTTEPIQAPVVTATPELVEVEVTPTSCLDAIDWLLDDAVASRDVSVEILGDYVDWPDENLAEFGQRVEDRLLAYDVDEGGLERAMRDVDACRAAR